MSATDRHPSDPSQAMPVVGAGRRVGALLLLALSICYASATRVVFSPMQELAKAELALTDFQLSLVQGLAASIPIALLSLPLGRLVDRSHRMRLLLAMTAISCGGTLMTAYAHGFAWLFLARMLAGLGSVCALPVAISIAADLSLPEGRGRTLLYLSVGNIAGAAAAFGLGGFLLARLGLPTMAGALAPWRGVHVDFALAGGAVLLALLWIREPARHELGDVHGAPLRVALAALWARRALLAPLFLGQVTVVMADTAAAIWAAPVLSRSYHLQPQDFAGWMGLVILLSGLLGSVAGGFAADLGHRSGRPGGILLGAAGAALLSIPAAFYPVMPTVPGFAALLMLFLMCGAVTGLVTATAIAVLVPNELRGICLGAFVVVGGVIGFGVTPTLVSVTSNALGGEGHLGVALSAVGAFTSAAAFAGFALALRAARRAAALGDIVHGP